MAQTPKSHEPSPMVRKFLVGDVFTPDPNFDYNSFRRELYFFYGTLMDPKVLARVLRLKEVPTLRPAKVIGYKCAMWGPYPALVDDEPGQAVPGVVYEVQSPSEKRRLEEYETEHYRDARCIIELGNGTKTRGRTFKWNKGSEELREGTFDLRDWLQHSLER